MNHPNHPFLPRATAFILQSLTPTNQQTPPTVTLLAVSPSNPIVAPTTFLSSMSATVTPFSSAYSTTTALMKSNVSSPVSTII